MVEPGPTGRTAGHRPRTGRGAPQRDRPIAAAFRLPVVLCYFEGLTLDEAARRLRCPAGTVRSRLARARDKLRRGLTRRGVVLPAAAFAAALDSRSASASVSSSLCDITTQAAIDFAAGQAASEPLGLGDGPCPGGAEIHARHKLKFVALTFCSSAPSPPARGIWLRPGHEENARPASR